MVRVVVVSNKKGDPLTKPTLFDLHKNSAGNKRGTRKSRLRNSLRARPTLLLVRSPTLSYFRVFFFFFSAALFFDFLFLPVTQLLIIVVALFLFQLFNNHHPTPILTMTITTSTSVPEASQSGAPQFLIFFSSGNPPWCPDCVDAQPAVEKVFGGNSNVDGHIVLVGEKPE